MNVDSIEKSDKLIIVHCTMTAPIFYHKEEIDPIVYQSSHKSWARVTAAANFLKRELNIKGFFLYATSEHINDYWEYYKGYQIWKFIFSRDQIG